MLYSERNSETAVSDTRTPSVPWIHDLSHFAMIYTGEINHYTERSHNLISFSYSGLWLWSIPVPCDPTTVPTRRPPQESFEKTPSRQICITTAMEGLVTAHSNCQYQSRWQRCRPCGCTLLGISQPCTGFFLFELSCVYEGLIEVGIFF